MAAIGSHVGDGDHIILKVQSIRSEMLWEAKPSYDDRPLTGPPVRYGFYEDGLHDYHWQATRKGEEMTHRVEASPKHITMNIKWNSFIKDLK